MVENFKVYPVPKFPNLKKKQYNREKSRLKKQGGGGHEMLYYYELEVQLHVD